MEAQSSTPVLTESPASSQSPSETPTQKVANDAAQLKGLLAEARNTRELLLDFETAIKNASFQGHQMLSVAKGVAFLQAIMTQNKAHIENLQERLK